jgi:hypothetical protein
MKGSGALPKLIVSDGPAIEVQWPDLEEVTQKEAHMFTEHPRESIRIIGLLQAD